MEEIKEKIGIEIHGYIVTKEKLFCRCPTNYKEAEPNTNICPICTGQPGSKPMLPNSEALKKAISIALLLKCRINSSKLIWQRKHYDWPDLPKGYQNTMSGAYSIPLGENGEYLGIKIREIHLEEDPAQWNPETGNVDYNRSGLPLVEIVTEPDFKDSKQVAKWLNRIVLAMSYINALNSDAGIKADINISVNAGGKQGERVEIKNLNSIDAIEKAINYEILRQADTLKKGEKTKRETRTFDEARNITVSMREKEIAEDYRFIPEPDLPIIQIKQAEIDNIKKSLPELPHKKIERFIEDYKIDKDAAEVLASDIDLANFFEKVADKINSEIAARWVTIELLRILNWNKKTLPEVQIKPEHFIELLKLVQEKKITELAAKQILNKFIPKSFSPAEKLKKSAIITDKSKIEKICEQIIKENRQAVDDYKSGKQEALKFLIGKVIEKTRRRADPKIVYEILKNLLKS